MFLVETGISKNVPSINVPLGEKNAFRKATDTEAISLAERVHFDSKNGIKYTVYD